MNTDHTTCDDPRCADKDCIAKRKAIDPDHYRLHPSGIECIEITRHMDFLLGNAFKYLFRCGRKGDALEDLKKARWYVEDSIKLRRKMWFNGSGKGYVPKLDAPHNVFLVMSKDCRYSGHMSAALGWVWGAFDNPRSLFLAERALVSINKCIGIELHRREDVA